MKNPIRVLSIDGGGIRGIIPLYFLAQLEEASGKRAHEIFDVIAGTSTGGIIALGLSKYTAREILNLYLENATEIFQRRWWIKGPKYSAEAKHAYLSKIFGSTPLSAAKVPTLVTAFDISRDLTYRLCSHWSDDILLMNRLDMTMADAASATSAAPTYFAPHMVESTVSGAPDIRYHHAFLDGGVFANNPSMESVVYALDLYPRINRKDIKLLSLSTGSRDVKYKGEDVATWWQLSWLGPIIHILMDGTSKTVEAGVDALLDDGHFRIKPILHHSDGELDNYSDDNMHSLLLDAENMTKAHKKELKTWTKIARQKENKK